MNGFRWVGFWATSLVWLAAGVGCVYATESDAKPEKAETVVIPLDQIWGYNMPNTKSIEKHLAPKSYGRTLEAIYRTLQPGLESKAARPSFAVTGNVDYVIEQMHQVLVEKEKPKLRFQADSQMSLVFFAHPSSFYVQLNAVNRKGTEITIRYQFVPHESADSTAHLAIIPLGKLLPEEYSVHIEKVSMENRFAEAGWISPDAKASQQLISQPFSFVVTQ